MGSVASTWSKYRDAGIGEPGKGEAVEQSGGGGLVKVHDVAALFNVRREAVDRVVEPVRMAAVVSGGRMRMSMHRSCSCARISASVSQTTRTARQ